MNPKHEFMKNEKLAGKWQDLVADPLFQDAAAKAFQQYAIQVSQEGTKSNELAISGVRLQGAREVLFILMNLGKPVRLPRAEETIQNLEPV